MKELYYFNPNYRMIFDTDKVLLISNYSFSRKKEQFEGDLEFESNIHPIYAMALTFFNGDTFENTVNSISENLEMESGIIEEIFKQLIENENKLFLEYNGVPIVFPKHTIVKTKEVINDYVSYDPFNFSNYKDVNLKNARTHKPIDLTLMISTICYTNCNYCYADKSKKIHCTLSLERIKELIHEAKSLNMRSFDIIGGELFTYPHWYELLKELNKNGYEPFISTKYPLNEDQVKKISEFNLPELQISLDSIKPETLKKLLKTSDEYLSKIINTLKLLEKYNNPVSIHTILTSHNANTDNMSSLLEFINEYNNINSWRLDYVRKSFYMPVPFEEMRVSENVEELMETFFDNINKSKYHFDINYSGRLLMKQWDRNKFLYNGMICPANQSSFFILPDGQVTVCEQMYWNPEYIIGDVNNQSLLEVWQSVEAVELNRRRLTISNAKSPCSKCKDIEYCHSSNLICFSNILLAYGHNNWDFPDPKCFNAPEPFNIIS
ncbi:MAG: radical SAM protein [Bacteroidales bacterium]|nr:radical SAM protein [Bacteroidales bacterium]